MIHINNFIDKIKALESQNSKNFNMSMREAKDLHADITKLLLALQELHSSAPQQNVDTIQVKFSGEDW